jgi:hypothetical protein
LSYSQEAKRLRARQYSTDFINIPRRRVVSGCSSWALGPSSRIDLRFSVGGSLGRVGVSLSIVYDWIVIRLSTVVIRPQTATFHGVAYFGEQLLVASLFKEIVLPHGGGLMVPNPLDPKTMPIAYSLGTDNLLDLIDFVVPGGVAISGCRLKRYATLVGDWVARQRRLLTLVGGLATTDQLPGVDTRHGSICGHLQANCVRSNLEDLILVLPGFAMPMLADVASVFVRPAEDAYKVILVRGGRLDCTRSGGSLVTSPSVGLSGPCLLDGIRRGLQLSMDVKHAPADVYQPFAPSTDGSRQ